MNRIIKFRVWAAKKMWRLHSIDYGNFDDLGVRVNVSENGSLGFPLCSIVKLLQFTGLTDKNGKEIYEGDIVCVQYYPKKHFVVPVEFYEIVFNNGAFWAKEIKLSFNREELLYLFSNNILNDRKCRIKVIGNIFENPTLLK